MRLEHECKHCPMRDRHLKRGRKVKRRLLWHYVKAKVLGKPLHFPCWPRKIAEYRANHGSIPSTHTSTIVAPGTHPGVNRPPGGPPLRSGPSGDTGEPGAPDPP